MFVKWIVYATLIRKCVMSVWNVLAYSKKNVSLNLLHYQVIGHESRTEIFLLRPLHPPDEE